LAYDLVNVVELSVDQEAHLRVKFTPFINHLTSIMPIIQEHLFESFFTTSFLSSAVLTPRERLLITDWSEKRINEFSTGRYCARKTLEASGLEHHDLLIGAGREPLWPESVTGSISHCENLVGAISAKKDKVRALGLDIEIVGKVEREIWDLVFTATEQNFLKALEPEFAALFSTVIFSAKECFYKLQFPLTKTYIDFKDIEISFNNGELKLYWVKEYNDIAPIFNNVVLKFIKQKSNVITYGYLL
jgi:4'-phosphopantetheinyl transferase EntD